MGWVMREPCKELFRLKLDPYPPNGTAGLCELRGKFQRRAGGFLLRLAVPTPIRRLLWKRGYDRPSGSAEGPQHSLHT
jgi:hypothetical protein